MPTWRSIWLLIAAVLLCASSAEAQQEAPGAIRGRVYNRDFEMVLAGATITVVEAERTATSGAQGDFLIRDLPPGQYTVIVSASGFVSQVPPKVLVSPGGVYDLGTIELAADFTELEEFVAQDLLQMDTGTEAGLLQLRIESPSLIDSISSDLMSKAGASDAAGALKLVPGATVKDGKSAVIRGLPDRYVSSQMNGVRLPTADEDKRAVELDQFPSAVIENIQVSKTFTPDQQGDASGGAVDIRLKGLPDEFFFEFKSQIGFNSQTTGNDEFLTYRGGGVGFWDDGAERRAEQENGTNWDGAVGVSRGSASADHKWSAAFGGSHEFSNGVRFGGLLNFFYERDNSYYDNGIDDSYWVEEPGEGLVPKLGQRDGANTYKTQLLDVSRGSQEMQWGTLATFGVEWEDHQLGLVYLSTQTTEDTATLAEDTRGKEYFFPGYDPGDPTTPGHEEPDAAPYLRLETLEYTERNVTTLQLNGRHTFTDDGFGPFGRPEFDWTLADSSASMNQPDKRQFGSVWFGDRIAGGLLIDSNFRQYKPDANFTLGNLQRIFKRIDETSSQYFFNLKLPFQQWSGLDSYLKFGVFDDEVKRKYRQESYSNFTDPNNFFNGDWDEFWSEAWGTEDHIITEALVDVDYDGDLDVSATYMMANMPLHERLTMVTGVRFEKTNIDVVLDPEEEAKWFKPGFPGLIELNPGDGDASISDNATLPSLTFIWDATDTFTVRTAFARTIARPTFKELTPVLQQEFLGGPIFIGDPRTGLSSLENYDLRLDYTPYPGGLVSASYFIKDIKDPIEYVQRAQPFDYTTPVNYPEGELSGYELEFRQDLGYWTESLEGFSMGANATFINSNVDLPQDEIDEFADVEVDLRDRDMTAAPEHLYNVFLTYDVPASGTQLALFYTMQGDTLVEGAGIADGNFIPSVYAKSYDTLNFSLTQPFGQYVRLRFQAKNLTDPEIDTVYRAKEIGGDVTKTRFTAGVDYSIALTVRIPF
ncbi:MAG: hypothetical protein CMJ94_07145 [Planctomycetes bacterium]|nr:hypothetical protein [Planctomycetota bacterium]